MKALKYVIFAVLGLLLLAVVGAVVFAMTFDPNRYKDQIEAVVKQQTGRTLTLKGDLEVAFFPNLGADVSGVTLSEKDPSKEFLSLERAHGSVAVMPLLRGEVVVDGVQVKGLRARVVKDKEGRFNFQDLLEGKQGATKDTPQGGEGKGGQQGDAAVRFDIAGVQIEDSAVSYTDLATGRELTLSDVDLSTGRVAEQAEGKLRLSSNVKGSKPALDLKVALNGGYRIDLPAQAYAFSGVEGSVEGTLEKDSVSARLSAPKLTISADKASGEAVVAAFTLKGPDRTAQADLKIAGIEGSAKALSIPQLSANVALAGAGMPRELKVPVNGSLRANLEKETLEADLTSKFDESNIQAKLGLARFSPPSYVFDVKVDRLNLDQYFPPEKKPAGAEQPGGKPSGGGKPAETPVDLSVLDGLDANGKLQIGALQARGLKLGDVQAVVKAAGGRLDVSPHSAKLYDGTLGGTLTLQAKGNRVSMKETMSSVAVGPLLRDVAQVDRLEGQGNVALEVSGAGPTVEAIKRSLDGVVKIDLRDGAVKGIDIASLLRKVKSLGKAEEGAADDKQKTDFSEMHATFVIKDGVATNKDLDIKSPLLRVTGAGKVDLGSSTLDYTAKAAVVASTKGQGGKELDQLAGVTVPVQLSGPFDALKYKVDYGAVAADMAKTKVGAKVKERVEERREEIEDRVKDRLKGLLKR